MRDGKTHYNHIAYATGENGEGFSLVEFEGQLFYGGYEDSSPVESTDASDYQWWSLETYETSEEIEVDEAGDEYDYAVNSAISYASQVASSYIDPAEPDYEEYGNNGFVGTLDAQNVNVVNMNADNIVSGTIDANKINVNNLKAESIVSGILSTDRLNASEIATNVITAGSLDTRYAKMDNANISNLASGTIDADSINIKNINGNEIKNSSILASALSNEAVQTLGGNKVYYQAEEPTGTFKTGDTWYKTVVPTGYTGKILFVWDGSSWVGSDFDAKLLRANTITAQEIASNTITANEISIADLHSLGATIGGWNIDQSAIHTSGKTSYSSNTKGAFLGSNGNLGIGQGNGNHIQYNSSTGDIDIQGNLKISSGTTVSSMQESIDELNTHVSDFENSANDSIEALQSATVTKIDSSTQNGNGFMKWQNDALQIVGINGANYYATEIGGNGIDFKYGANESDAKTVAKINQNQLEIKQTIVFDEMKVGKWAWTVDNNDSLMLRWAGDN